MITEYYYSSLNDEVYRTKEEAQSAEDKYVEDYFADLQKRAAMKRRVLNKIVAFKESSMIK